MSMQRNLEVLRDSCRQYSCTDRNSLPDDAAAYCGSSVAEAHNAVNLHTSSNVVVITNDDIVLDQSLTVYDAVPSDEVTCIDHRATEDCGTDVHEDIPCQISMWEIIGGGASPNFSSNLTRQLLKSDDLIRPDYRVADHH
jgi:hypothetical protein